MRNRCRTTGAIFLIALAIIFLPMLFDGAGVAKPEIPDMKPVENIEPVAAIEDVAPATDTEARVDALREEVDAEGYNKATDTIFGAPVLSEPDESTAVWAVQLASFADEDNARQLRQRLNDDGYNALLSHVKTDDKKLVRVAIGPLLTREDAEALLQKLSAAYDLEARLMAFSY